VPDCQQRELRSRPTPHAPSCTIVGWLDNLRVAARLVHHKLKATMAERDAQEPIAGDVQLDDAYSGGKRPGEAGCGSPHKVHIVAAGPPIRLPAWTPRGRAALQETLLRQVELSRCPGKVVTALVWFGQTLEALRELSMLHPPARRSRPGLPLSSSQRAKNQSLTRSHTGRGS